MIVLDSLFYYLTYFFTKNKQDLTWSSPIERAVYVIGIMTISLFLAVSIFLEYEFPLYDNFHMPKLFFILLGFIMMQLYKYIYVKKDRYQIIVNNHSSKISDDTGAYICIAIVLLLIMSPMIIILIFVPFGIDRPH